MDMIKLFQAMTRFNASDLFIKAGQPPVYRVGGVLSRMQNTPSFSPEQCDEMLTAIMSDRHRAALAERGNTDFAWYREDVGRFRCNIFRQRGCLSAAIRKVNLKIPTYQELRLPPQIARIPELEMGLVLIGGITGSGKSTTLAAILGDIVSRRRCHVLTIEDPIEYLLPDDKAIVNQREIGLDVIDFKEALRSMVRENPDVILIGEMRDAETFETALTAAETGHLVFGTIHASGCAQTFGRILDLFPEEKHAWVRNSLAFNLRCILNQKLLIGATKEVPRVPAVETMFMTPIVRKLILEGQDARIAEAIKMDTEYGCESYNQVLIRLYNQKLVSMDVALHAAPNPEELRMAMRGITITDQGGVV